MNNQETQDKQQQQRRDDQDLLQRERKARGEVRDSHLDAGRERARSDNALARESTPAEPPTGEDTSEDDYEAQRKERKAADRATMKAEARSRYDGSDEEFENDWPDIRERLVAEGLENDLKQIHRGL